MIEKLSKQQLIQLLEDFDNAEDFEKSLQDQLEKKKDDADLFEDTFVFLKGLNGPKFGRYGTLDEDINDLRKKWRGEPNEVLVEHMYSSLKIFNHDRKQLGNVNSKRIYHRLRNS